MYFGILSEELILILLDPKSGKIKRRNRYLIHGILGGFLLDLVMLGRLTIIENEIIVIDETPVEDEILNFVSKTIQEEDENLSIYYWIKTLKRKISNPEKLLLDKLVNRGIIKVEPKNIFGIIPSQRYFYTNPNLKEIIRTKICQVINEKEESDYRTLALLSLIYTTNCETEIFTKKELEMYLHKIRNIVSSDEIGKSITTAINNTVEALMSNLILTQTY
jgi:hypothetical protein